MKDHEIKKRLVQMADGSVVEHDVLNVVEKITAYDPRLKVKYCDPALTEFGDAPYKLVEVCPDGMERVVFDIWELDERILERLRAADTFKGDILAQIDSHNALVRKRQNQRFRETVGEANDIFSHYLRSPKTTYSWVDPLTKVKVTVDSQEGRATKKEVKN